MAVKGQPSSVSTQGGAPTDLVKYRWNKQTTANMAYPGPGPGRPKGSKNKMNAQVREMVLAALSQAGGVDYLVRQARDNPTAFLSLIGKIIPREVDATVGGGVTVSWPLPRTVLDGRQKVPGTC